MNTQPIRTLFIPIVVAALVAAGQAFLDGADVRGIVSAVLAALVLVAQELARKYVTPLGEPKTDDGTPLVPLDSTVVT